MSARRDITELSARRKLAGKPDQPLPTRSASFDSLAERVRQVAAARTAEDQTACRAELRELAREALVLSRADPLWR